MKKLFTIMVLIMTLNLSSQNWPPSGTVHIVSTEPREMCDHDSMQVNFRFIFSGNPDTVVPWGFRVWVPPFGFYFIKNFKYPQFYGLTKNLVGADTIYSFKFFYSSTAGNPINYPLGQNLVCISGQLSCVTIHVFECPEPNGIDELNPYTTKPVYYDLYGNIIEQRKNEVIVEKIGNRRRKIVIQ